MRRQQVQQRHLLGNTFSMEQLLTSANVPNYEGIRIFDGARDPWNYDDSGNILKHTLCQIEVDRQRAITARVDRDGKIDPGALRDPWQPLRELSSNLLPHLRFERIDSANRDQVRVLWKVHGLDTLVDLDDLSSGEKSIIQMFYPLVEREIKSLIKEIESGPQAAQQRPELAVLIDEPELHLHPNLQFKVIDYLRVLTSGLSTQVIVATHSPTIVEYASFEELYLLKPVELVAADENQLAQVADNNERLGLLRQLFGTTTNLTSLQSLVVVEGVEESRGRRVVPDRKVYRALHEKFDRVTILPGGGKAECKALLRALRDVLPRLSPRLRVVALLDSDAEGGPADPDVKLLPVSMIENFLLDHDVIWEVIQSVLEKTSLKTVDDLSAALDKVLDECHDGEVGRQAAAILGPAHFYPPSDVAVVEAKATDFVAAVTAQYSKEQLDSASIKASEIVKQLQDTKQRREHFHGKKALEAFYARHLHQTGLSKVVFVFEAARHARRRKSVVTFFNQFFEELLNRK
jgi:hypothetical protein